MVPPGGRVVARETLIMASLRLRKEGGACRTPLKAPAEQAVSREVARRSTRNIVNSQPAWRMCSTRKTIGLEYDSSRAMDAQDGMWVAEPYVFAPRDPLDGL